MLQQRLSVGLALPEDCELQEPNHLQKGLLNQLFQCLTFCFEAPEVKRITSGSDVDIPSSSGMLFRTVARKIVNRVGARTHPCFTLLVVAAA